MIHAKVKDTKMKHNTKSKVQRLKMKHPKENVQQSKVQIHTYTGSFLIELSDEALDVDNQINVDHDN